METTHPHHSRTCTPEVGAIVFNGLEEDRYYPGYSPILSRRIVWLSIVFHQSNRLAGSSIRMPVLAADMQMNWATDRYPGDILTYPRPLRIRRDIAQGIHSTKSFRLQAVLVTTLSRRCGSAQTVLE